METFKQLCRTIAAYELIIYLLLLPLALFPSPARLPALLIIPILWLANRIANGRFFPNTPLNISLLLLTFMILVSMYATFDMAFSLGKIIGLWYGIGLFFAIVSFIATSIQRQRWTMGAVLLIGMAIGAVGLLAIPRAQSLPLISTIVAAIGGRISSLQTAINPNQTAGVMVWIIPLALALMVAAAIEVRRHHRAALLVLLITGGMALFLTAVLILTSSRGGLLGLIVGVGAMVVILLRKQWRWVLMLAVIGLLIGGVLWWQKSEEITAVFATQADFNLDDPASSIDGRIEIWSRAIYGLQDFPFTGMGMNNFRRVVHILYPLFLISPDSDIAHAHNQWLQAGLDLGLPGLIAYAAIWLGAGVMLIQTWRYSRDFWQRAWTIGFAGAMAASLVYGITDAVALGAKPGFLWWMMLGLITGSFLYARNVTRPTSADRVDNDSANGRLPSSPTPTDAHPQ